MELTVKTEMSGTALAADMQNLPVCWQDEECQSYMASHFRKKP